MKHTINLPANCPLLDELHTYLWKRFPMDQFEFIGLPGESVPRYTGSTQSYGSATVDDAAGMETSTFVESVHEAVEAFVAEHTRVAA